MFLLLYILISLLVRIVDPSANVSIFDFFAAPFVARMDANVAASTVAFVELCTSFNADACTNVSAAEYIFVCVAAHGDVNMTVSTGGHSHVHIKVYIDYSNDILRSEYIAVSVGVGISA